MRTRVRTINKVRNGTYVTTSWKVSDYLVSNILYLIFIYIPYLIIKYLFYIPIKWCVNKLISLIKNKDNNKWGNNIWKMTNVWVTKNYIIK